MGKAWKGSNNQGPAEAQRLAEKGLLPVVVTAHAIKRLRERSKSAKMVREDSAKAAIHAAARNAILQNKYWPSERGRVSEEGHALYTAEMVVGVFGDKGKTHHLGTKKNPLFLRLAEGNGAMKTAWTVVSVWTQEIYDALEDGLGTNEGLKTPMGELVEPVQLVEPAKGPPVTRTNTDLLKQAVMEMGMTVTALARGLGFKESSPLYNRVERGWTVPEAVTIPSGVTRAQAHKGALQAPKPVKVAAEVVPAPEPVIEAVPEPVAVAPTPETPLAKGLIMEPTDKLVMAVRLDDTTWKHTAIQQEDVQTRLLQHILGGGKPADIKFFFRVYFDVVGRF